LVVPIKLDAAAALPVSCHAVAEVFAVPKVPLPSNTSAALPVKLIRAISPLVLVRTIAPFAPLASPVALIFPCT